MRSDTTHDTIDDDRKILARPHGRPHAQDSHREEDGAAEDEEEAEEALARDSVDFVLIVSPIELRWRHNFLALGHDRIYFGL